MFNSGREASQFSVQVREQFASYKSRSGSGDLLEIKWKKKQREREREKKLREPESFGIERAFWKQTEKEKGKNERMREPSGRWRCGKKERMWTK